MQTTTEYTERLSVEQAAGYLGVSASTMNKWRLTGDGPAYHKLSRRVTYSRSDLDSFLATKRHTSTSEYGSTVVVV